MNKFGVLTVKEVSPYCFEGVLYRNLFLLVTLDSKGRVNVWKDLNFIESFPAEKWDSLEELQNFFDTYKM